MTHCLNYSKRTIVSENNQVPYITCNYAGYLLPRQVTGCILPGDKGYWAGNGSTGDYTGTEGRPPGQPRLEIKEGLLVVSRFTKYKIRDTLHA